MDANSEQVVSALRAAGASVEVIHKPVDLLVGGVTQTGEKRMLLMEVKDGKDKTLTSYQKGFFSRWDGYPIARVDGPDAAVRAYRVLIA